MSAAEDPPVTPEHDPAKHGAIASESAVPPDTTFTASPARSATSPLPDSPSPVTTSTTATNPFEDTAHTPELPPRPTDDHAMAVSVAPATPEVHVHVGAQEEPVSPQVEALRAMFPDFDVAVLQSVLESVNNDQDRALDILLGMSDPEYVSTQTSQQPAVDTTDIDEALARQLVFEDQQEQRARRHATGESWPRREDPLQADGHAPYQPRRRGEVPPEEARTDFQEIQRTMNQIAESGKRTFSSIVSRVKAKINEYEQSRGPSSGASTMPQWGSGASMQPTNVDRHTASQAYQQRYFAPSPVPEPSPNPMAVAQQPSPYDVGVQGYDVDVPVVQSSAPAPPQPQTPPPAREASSAATVPISGLSPAASPRPSSDVPRPPATMSGSPVNAAKIGLLPKRPVSLLNTNTPPATRPSDEDDELEYVENPFEERK